MEGQLATDVVLHRDIARIRMTSRDERCDWTRLVEVLEQNDIHADTVDLACRPASPACVAMTLLLRSADMPRVWRCFDDVSDYDIACEHGLAMVSVSGFGISSDLAAVERIIHLLNCSRIGVHELLTSESRIDCFVNPESADRAAELLNQELCSHAQAA